ncbi:MAG: prepilin-type N-terminal cleavage/methylation domain-containing protein, partial [Elusimicrobiaceae bacterium]|nr:prepilin-type N-terminal cleavage/methylation domain-containing protein [Elusimicrobiaceae bacterium]
MKKGFTLIELLVVVLI